MLKDESPESDGKLAGSTGTSLHDFCPQVSIALCRYNILCLLEITKAGNYVGGFQELSKDIFHA